MLKGRFCNFHFLTVGDFIVHWHIHNKYPQAALFLAAGLNVALPQTPLSALQAPNVGPDQEVASQRRAEIRITPSSQAQVIDLPLCEVVSDRWNLSFLEARLARKVFQEGGDAVRFSTKLGDSQWRELAYFSRPSARGRFRGKDLKDQYQVQHCVLEDRCGNRVAVSRPFDVDVYSQARRRDFGFLPLKVNSESTLHFKIQAYKKDQPIGAGRFGVEIAPEMYPLPNNSQLFVEPGLDINPDPFVTNPDGNTPVAYMSGLLPLFQNNEKPDTVIWSEKLQFYTDTHEHLHERPRGRHRRRSPSERTNIQLFPHDNVAVFTRDDIVPDRALKDVCDDLLRSHTTASLDSTFGNEIKRWIKRDEILVPSGRPTEYEIQKLWELMMLGGGGGIWSDNEYHFGKDKKDIERGEDRYLRRIFSRCVNILQDHTKTVEDMEVTLRAYMDLPVSYRAFFERLMRSTYEEYQRTVNGDTSNYYFKLELAPDFLRRLRDGIQE